MHIVAKFLIGIVAVQHIFFLWLEMFAWTTRGSKVFVGFPKELFEPTKQLAANQGLYNGFLAAGLIWSLWIKDIQWSEHVAIFFVSCVIVAALYGAYSADKKIFFVQGLPAIFALAAILFL